MRIWCETVYQCDPANNIDKYYRTFSWDDGYLFQHGRTGVTKNFSLMQNNLTIGLANTKVTQQMRSKQREGYSGLRGVAIDADRSLVLSDDRANKVELARLCDEALNRAGQTPPVPDLPPPPLPAAPTGDMLHDFIVRALAAVTAAASDPAKGASELAVLNIQWLALEQEISKARSYLSTLDTLVIGATAS